MTVVVGVIYRGVCGAPLFPQRPIVARLTAGRGSGTTISHLTGRRWDRRVQPREQYRLICGPRPYRHHDDASFGGRGGDGGPRFWDTMVAAKRNVERRQPGRLPGGRAHAGAPVQTAGFGSGRV